MKKDNKQEYDLFISLGGACPTTQQFRLKNLQYVSLPFDWLYNRSPKMLSHLCDFFKEDFASWLKKENLIELENNILTDTKAQYKDTVSEYVYIHDFVVSINNLRDYTRVTEKYQKRIKRMIKLIEKSNKIMLGLFTINDIDEGEIEKFLAYMNERFPNKTFDFIHNQFQSEHEEEGLVHNSEHIKIYRYKRELTVKDHNGHPDEWEFLREYKLSDYGKKLQHQTGIMSLIRPYFYIKKIEKGYLLHFASKHKLKFFAYFNLWFRLKIVAGKLQEVYLDNE